MGQVWEVATVIKRFSDVKKCISRQRVLGVHVEKDAISKLKKLGPTGHMTRRAVLLVAEERDQEN